MDQPPLFTVGELRAALAAFPSDARVTAFQPGSTNALPPRLAFTDGVVQIVGDELAERKQWEIDAENFG